MIVIVRTFRALTLLGIAALMVGTVFAALQHQANGTVEGQALGQPPRALSGITVQAFEANGAEEDACQTDNSGSFTIRVPTASRIYSLIFWDELNRWWPWRLSDLRDDPAHLHLGAIVLRPQTESLPADKRGEESSIVNWLRRHNPLSAALMEVHLGAFDKTAEPGPLFLRGAGAVSASSPFDAWNLSYAREHAGVDISYEQVGSGGGIGQMSAGVADFGAADIALSNKQIAELKLPVYQLPVALTAVVFVHSERALPHNIRFTGPVLAKIFLGQITVWNDPALERLNPTVKLPNLRVVVVHRSDSAAATKVLADYLSKVSLDWKEHMGSSGAVEWPVGIGGKGNEGVAGAIAENEGSIGYVDFSFAEANRLESSPIENKAGRFVEASRQSISSAASSAETEPNLASSITDTPAQDGYPVSSKSWLLVPGSIDNLKKTFVLLDYVNFSLSQPPSETEAPGYVPLPPPLVAKVKITLNRIAARLLDASSVGAR